MVSARLGRGVGRRSPAQAIRAAASIGLADETLYPVEGDLIVDQLLFDSGGREAEIRRQAARTDAAAARVEERCEFVALNVARAYIDYLLQQRLVAIAEDNATFHERLAGDLREGVSKGSISIADQQQAEERLQSARARVTEAREDLDTAAIEFQTLTGAADRQRVDAARPVAVDAGDARRGRSAGARRRTRASRKRSPISSRRAR